MHKAFSQNNFKERVIAIVRKIPRGKTMSYKQVAVLAGHPLAARAVGAIMRANKDKTTPCHRVIKSDGTLGGYNGIRGEKRRLLKIEGFYPVYWKHLKENFYGALAVVLSDLVMKISSAASVQPEEKWNSFLYLKLMLLNDYTHLILSKEVSLFPMLT